MSIESLNLDLPTFSEIKAQKALEFPDSNNNGVYRIFTDMNAMQTAIANALDENAPEQSSLVFSGIRWLGNRLPEAEIEVREPNPSSDLEDETKAIPDHPMVYQWNWANRRQTGSVLMKAFAYSWILSGNVFFIKFRNQVGLPVELWYEPHWSITPRWLNDSQGQYLPISETRSAWLTPGKRGDLETDFINYYEISRGNKKFRLEVEDILHFQDGIDPNYPRKGISGLTTLLREITGDARIADYYTNLLGSNGLPPYAVSIDKEMQVDLEEVIKIKDGLRRLRPGEPAVVSGATFQPLGFSPKDMDNRVARYLSEERFAAVTGIPAQCLNLGVGGERSIYNNVSEANRQGTQDVLVPLWGHIADTLTRQLLNDFDQAETRYVDFDLKNVKALQESEDDKAKRIRDDWLAGIITRDEARVARGYTQEKKREKLDHVFYVPSGSEVVDADAPVPDPEEKEPGLPQPSPQQLALVRKALNSAPKTVRELYEAKDKAG
jgi:HK97 family phage portal protein